jgi:hypothetical protein
MLRKAELHSTKKIIKEREKTEDFRSLTQGDGEAVLKN